MARNEKVTILDIARHTGLSKGTVDRVLHNRGEVSKRSYDKIMAAVRELGYEPNIHASLLARGGNPLIAVLIPRHSPDSFWDLASQGIAKASESVEAIDVDIRLFEYDQYDLESFREACNRLVDASPAGVVLAPIFRDETDLLTSRLSLSGIPYVFVDSKPDKEDYLAYFGMPPYRSGYLCADQLTGGRKIASALTVRIRRDRQQQSDPTLNRRAGFMDYMLEHNPECTLSSIFIDPNDPEGVEATLSEWFESHPEVHHIVMFNSIIAYTGMISPETTLPIFDALNEEIVFGFSVIDMFCSFANNVQKITLICILPAFILRRLIADNRIPRWHHER